MIGYVSKAFFHTLAGSRTLKQLASRYGMRRPNSFARRFIAGETIDEACINALYMERTAKIMAIARLHGYQGPTAESIQTQSESRQKLFRRPRDEIFHSADWNYYAEKVKRGERWTRGLT